jgi:hypothetical protein
MACEPPILDSLSQLGLRVDWRLVGAAGVGASSAVTPREPSPRQQSGGKKTAYL